MSDVELPGEKLKNQRGTELKNEIYVAFRTVEE